MELLTRAMETIRQSYVDESQITYEQLVEGALEGMLRRLDPHCEYMGKSLFEDMQREQADTSEGVGLTISLKGGYLTIAEPWPSMLRGIWGDPERFVETYWSKFDGIYFAGDGAKWDEEGDLWLLGRVDDVMNVSGHRLSTAEIESALVSHEFVAEAAVVGAKDEITGQAVVAFVILRLDQVEEAGAAENISKILREHVSKDIGPIARPRQIMVVAELPKTRSGKIMRRLLRDVAEIGRAHV